MQGYFIKVGEHKQGPYLSKAAAAAEAKALKDKGYDVKVVQQAVNEAALMEALGNPEAEVELESEDDIDFDALFGDSDGDDDDGEGGDDDGDSSEDDESTDGDDDGDDDSGSEGDDEDEQPAGVHNWFKSWGKS